MRRAQVTRKFPHDCDISVQPRNPSNTKPLTHNVTAGEKNDTKSPPPDTQSYDSSQGPEEGFNLSSHSFAENHSSSALCLPVLTFDEFSGPQQGASQPHEEEEEEEEQQQQQQAHSMFQSSEHPHFPHCLPEQSEIVCNPPPSQPSLSSDVYIVPANYSCGHSCNRAAQSLPTVQCNHEHGGQNESSQGYGDVHEESLQSATENNEFLYLTPAIEANTATALDGELVCGQCETSSKIQEQIDSNDNPDTEEMDNVLSDTSDISDGELLDNDDR